MRIVIAGAGEVGTHLAKMLSHEDQDIILIDSDPDRLAFASRRLELMTQVGNPTSLIDLQEAGINKADLFISVTPEESTNITACMLASKLGAQRTIARINNHEYLQGDNHDFFEEMGVDSMIYPEELAAIEIVSTIGNPWARQYIELFNGSIVLIGVKVREGAPLVGKYLHELHKDNNKMFHIVAIKRDFETIIPSGYSQVLHNDIVFFTCSPDSIEDVRRMAGKRNPAVKKVVIMGASRIALRTIMHLPSHIKVCLIEQNKQKCLNLSSVVPSNVEIYHGDGRDPLILKEVGLEEAQVFIALSENSETNVLACLAAKRYGVFKTIAKEENIDYIPLAYRLDIGTLINKKLMAAGHIYRLLLGVDTSSVKCLTVANADVAELIAKRNSKITQKPIKDYKLSPNITFGGLVRNGVPMMINGDTQIEPYDHVVVFCHDISMSKLKDFFS
ncbi:Trk system potassium transporter TrkA [Porphyromonas pogonae]|uniref:Trk system potassium transporter TrkA n=1 Tax=Porphyromonas pogonae TaxID=867595 RepID=UPI002E78E4E7|nr:Trk system potassium transporter TrkA [Porphyromonas pogonae]